MTQAEFVGTGSAKDPKAHKKLFEFSVLLILLIAPRRQESKARNRLFLGALRARHSDLVCGV